MIEPVDATLRRWLSTESQIADSQITDHQIADRQITDRQITDRQITDCQITQSLMEGQGLEAVAQEALSELMRALPEARPRPGFADRVMAASGLETRFPHAWLEHPRKALEWLLAASEGLQGKPVQVLASVVLLLVGSAVAGLPSLAVWFSEVVSLADIFSGSVHLFTLAARSLATVMALGGILLSLYDALLLVLVSPPVMFASFGAFVCTTLALRWLTQLLSSPTPDSILPQSQRSDGYVPAH